ncbi:amino acid synthesis family protein [Methylobacterium soli]|uniref:Amino acid synthesis family protein n=1 Tax=Methylobacterium soli TaxID=553447 RepID=A0A6L3T6L6_9HYPH|nr:amino acid synthesis family protein [Methylobacterium soli]KAB1080836.1 amino acid synthesis family protein [Methylobacterium soli]GJE44387.1 hypothetical protein AEGHOMDF_3575 [Methylobacterium soli]
MSLLELRKIVTQIEETLIENGKPVEPASRKVAIAGVIKNPYAGKYVEDLSPLYDLGAEASKILAERGVAVLGVQADEVQSYGKGAIVGTAGEIEHSAALLHPRFGAPVRAAVGSGKDIIPGTKKVGAPGSAITMPMTNKDNIWDFDHMDAIEIAISDAPRPDEIVIVVCLGIGGRPLHRIGK